MDNNLSFTHTIIHLEIKERPRKDKVHYKLKH